MNPLLLGAGAIGAGYLGKKIYDGYQNASGYEDATGEVSQAMSGLQDENRRAQGFMQGMDNINSKYYKDAPMDYPTSVHTLKKMGAREDEIAAILQARGIKPQ